jgi:ferritin-like metal-binding protein YciE
MFGRMRLENLEELFVDELKDVYDAELHLCEALAKMEQAAAAPELKAAFRGHLAETQGQVTRLEQIFESLDSVAERKACKGIKGIIAEGEDYMKARGNSDAIDAALIAAAQRVEHYEISVYGTLRAYADTLGLRQQAALLQVSLDEERAADRKLTELAEHAINVEAAAG